VKLLLRISPSDLDYSSVATVAAFSSALQVASQLAPAQGTFFKAAPEFLFSSYCHFHHCAFQKYFAESSSYEAEMVGLMSLVDF
jgi:hypothetical protein